jgi:hypothetical protein
MKKIKLLLTTIFALFIAISCEDDGGKSKVDLIEGGVPNVKKIASTETTLNLISLSNDVPINLGLTIDVARGNVSSMDVIGIYKKGNVIEKGIIKTNITGFPATVNINQTDLFNAFKILNTKADFSLTDKLTISTDVILKDGKRLNMFNDDGTKGFAADINNSTQFSVSQEYTVFCPFDDVSKFSGNYKVVKDDWADYKAGDIVPVVYNAADGLLKFRILNSNNTALVNTSSYYLVTVKKSDGTVTVEGSETFDYGFSGTPPVQFTTKATGTGTIGSCTGDIDLKLNFSGSSQNQTFSLVKV